MKFLLFLPLILCWPAALVVWCAFRINHKPDQEELLKPYDQLEREELWRTR